MTTQTQALTSAKPTAQTGGVLQRQCACGNHAAGGECEECKAKREGQGGLLQRAPMGMAGAGDAAPPIVHEVLRSPGQPLDGATRAFMEPRLGRDFSDVRARTARSKSPQAALKVGSTHDEFEQEAERVATRVTQIPALAKPYILDSYLPYDFSQIRVHTDTKAAESARMVNARAYTVGGDVVFGAGQYAPSTQVGTQLLAHELTHVVQQAGSAQSAALHRSIMPGLETSEWQEPEQQQEQERPQAGSRSFASSTPPSPETCLPPGDMVCEPAIDSPGDVTNTLNFPVNSATLSPLQRAEIDAAAMAWNDAGGSVYVRVDGYASAEGQCDYNWGLSCRRAQAVAEELASPIDGSPGISTQIEIVAHGESDEAGSSLVSNRKATISIHMPPTLTPTQPQNPTQQEAMPTPVAQGNCNDSTFCTPYALATEAAAVEQLIRSTYMQAEGIATYGSEVAGLYQRFLDRVPGDSLDPVVFDNDSSYLVTAFKESGDTEDDMDMVIDLVGNRLSRAPGGLRDDVRTTMSLSNFLSDSEMANRPINYSNPFSVAGHIAGGIGSSDAGDDYRKITYANVTLEKTTLIGSTGYVKVELTPHYEVFDAIDFCPGDCGSPAEQLVTVPMSRLEASGFAYDVPFKVIFTPESRSNRFWF